jgi:hypothetical protein
MHLVDMLFSPRLLTLLALTAVAAAIPAAPALAKGDHDGLPDSWEKRHHLNLRIDDAARDKDRDGLSNYGEYRSHTNPRKRDSDRDHRGDGREDRDRDKLRNTQEIKTGNDPGDADSDDDGIKDGRENAGRITAVSGGSVTILLATGGKLTARLGPELLCSTASATPSSEAPDSPADGEPGDVPDPGEDDDSGEDDDFGGPDGGVAAHAAQVDEDADPGDDAPDDGTLDPEAELCASELKVGAIVHEAVVKLASGGLVLVEIELVEKRR